MTGVCEFVECGLWVESVPGSQPRRWKVYNGDSPYGQVTTERVEDALTKAHDPSVLLREADSGS